MKHYPYVILGGGVVAGYAAQTFVENGVQKAELCVVSAEKCLPYERPLLSKDFLAGAKPLAELLINPPNFYTEHGIEVRLETPVLHVDFEHNHLYLIDDTIAYDKLLIATGARPRHLTIPGADLEGIYYLRSMEDAVHIQQAAEKAARAVVIGGGFLGMEVASVLQRRGIETTLIFSEPHLCERLFTTRMAAFFETYFQQHGVTVLSQEKVTGFVSNDGHITHVSLASGKDLATDMVLAGIGVTPNLDLFRNSALQIEGGIVVNRFLEASLPNIYAAGDVACYRDLLYDRLRQVDHWDNAVTQGKYAAQGMMGLRREYVHVPYVFSDFFDLSYEFWGDTEDAESIIYRGDIEGGSFSVWWLSPSARSLATFVLNRPEEERTLAQQWIQEGKQLDAALIRDETQPLQENHSTLVNV